MENILELKGVSAGYDRRVVLRDVNLAIAPGDFIGITGPNGGGKTTLLKVILGLLPPRSGEVIYRVDLPALFGYLPQNNRFDARFPIHVEEVVLSGLMSRKGLLGRYTREDREQARRLLASCDMEALRGRSIGELSGGQLQRVLLCRAIIAAPRVLVLDEPATHVDNHFEAAFYSALAELNRDMSILMVSHDIQATRALVKSMIRVNNGACEKL
ncbi:MAG: ABC transporter ATP-binding protein [Odoribacteraceae bacterium]|jgi:zinc transport system ATP-binding protein|nr:ABC transporter ATP-binding protein [Odoribacteraceae bacterium]